MELIEQGHKATGTLVNSFEQRVLELPNSLVLEILMEDYGIYVNEGRRKNAKKVPLDSLIAWIERKAIVNGDKEIKNLAFAIQNKIYQEGSPTKGSFRFSNNGRRKGFIDFVIANELDFVYTELEQQVFKDYDATVASIVKDFNKNN